MEPLPIRYSGASEERFRYGVGASVGSVLAISLACSVVLAAIGLVTGGAVQEALLALALTLPGLLVQDAWRSAFFAWRRGRSAFLNDLLWAVVMFPALALVIHSGDHSIFVPTLVWGGSATVAALAGILQSRIIPAPLRTRAWWREHIDLGPRFVTEVDRPDRRLPALDLRHRRGCGPGRRGCPSGGRVDLGPVQVLFLGIGLIAVPEGVRALSRSLGHLYRLAIVDRRSC